MRWFYVRLTVGGAATLAAVAALPRPLPAQGFAVNEHSTCAMGRAGTAVASPCNDGSAIVFNPAGLAFIEKGHTTISVGGTLIAPSGSFTNDVGGGESRLNNRVFPIPALYITHGLRENIGVGIGLFAPYGLTTDWPDTSQARFIGYKSLVRAIYIQPTVAAKLGEFITVGAGFDLDFAHVQLRQQLELSSQPLPSPAPPGATFANLGIPTGTPFGDLNLSGNGTSVGFHLGVIVRPAEELSFGVRYLSRQKASINGGFAEVNPVPTGITAAAGNPFGLPPGTDVGLALSSQFLPDSLLDDQGATTALRLPEQWVFGLSVDPMEKLRLLFDVQLTHWSVFDTLAITLANIGLQALPQNFKNTTAFRFGAEYAYSPSTALRLGYITHNAAEPAGSVTPNLPEGKRSEFTGGVGTRLGQRLHVDVAYQYINQGDRRGRTVPFGLPDNGLFSFRAHLFGASFTYAF
ncbi:MAG: OmpP1/FadL family transporter [Gemmatimonadales bacterium]